MKQTDRCRVLGKINGYEDHLMEFTPYTLCCIGKGKAQKWFDINELSRFNSYEIRDEPPIDNMDVFFNKYITINGYNITSIDVILKDHVQMVSSTSALYGKDSRFTFNSEKYYDKFFCRLMRIKYVLTLVLYLHKHNIGNELTKIIIDNYCMWPATRSPVLFVKLKGDVSNAFYRSITLSDYNIKNIIYI